MRKNAKSVFCLVSLLVLVMLLALPGCKEEPAKSSKKDIISFEIGDARGVFDQIENNTTISLIVPADSDLSKLTPVITVSDGATVSPASGVENNFTNPVTYTVTAENGDIRHFTVNVEAAEKASENEILSFKIGDAGGVFYYDTISLIVPADSDLSKLTPVITVSDGATVSPASGVENNFTNPVTYTVTAGNGDIRHFTVNVEAAAKSSGKDIIDFKIGDAIGAIEEYNKTVSLTVPIDSDLSALTPVITVSNGAAVSPASDVEMDFTNPVTYKVTAEDGSIKYYTVTVEKARKGNLSLSVGLIANGDEDVTVYGIPAGGIVLAVSEQKDLPNPKDALPNKITISADDHDNVTWYIDNAYKDSNNIITIDAKDYTLNQPHNITVIVTKNGINYSENISFTVIR